MDDNVKTLVIDKFATGPTTVYQDGDINSGRSWVQSSGGYNPFIKPGQLTWSEAVERIDAGGSVITDLIMAGKTRVESGVTYVYAIGHTGRLYKIQVNDPTTYNPDYDNPTLLTTLAAESPTFTRGGFIDFFGATQKIYIGHDKGLTSINFDGTGEAFVGVPGSWVQNVPRPLEQFLGKLYIGNGANIAEIDSTATVTSYTKLSPGFLTGSQTRDIDVTPDGNYLQITVSRTQLPDLLAATQDTTSGAPSESYVFRWDGTTTGYTSYTTYPSISLNASALFQNYQYVFGTELSGTSIYNPTERVLQVPEQQCPMPNAIISTGSMLMWLGPLTFDGVLEVDGYVWGAYDYEQGVTGGYQDIMYFNASGDETDVTLVPLVLHVSNVGFGSSSNGYTDGLYSTSKLYISALETSSGSTGYKLYKWRFNLSPLDPGTTPVEIPIYQTQTQIFSKKIQVKQVRIYGEPWVANNSFRLDLIGSSGSAITGGSKTFSIGDGLTVGEDFAFWNPECAPTYALGLCFTNLGSTNHTISKVEIDYTVGGQ